MTSDDELQRRLEEWGHSDAVSPDPAFSERLEQDLRSAIYFRPTGGGSEPTRRLVFRPAFVLGALILLAGVAFLLTRDADEAQQVAIESAADTEVMFADGSRAAADAGTELPDGTRVEVGPDGTAVIDDVVLQPGDVALIVDGIVELITDAAPTPTPTNAAVAGSTADDAVTPTLTDVPTATPVTDVKPDETVSDRPTPTPVTDERPTPTPARDVAPTPVASPSPTDDPPQPTPEPTSPPAVPFTIELAAETLDGDRLRLSWTAVGAPADLGGWEVIALTPDGQRTIAVVRNVAETELTVSGRATGYQVLGRRIGGEILAESNVWPPTD